MSPLPKMLFGAWLALVCIHSLARAGEPVPPPEQTPVEVVVSGRSSTLKNITIRKAGQNIPATFSGQRVKNVDGFIWYVSRHYALKTNLSEKQAHHYLTLLELAFPHYVELFGRELPGLDQKRMAVIYAKDKKTLDQALKADGIAWNFAGGGITYEGYNAAYQYPSGGLQYHLRYILLHECTHLYHVCLTGTYSGVPGWFLEGIADTLANHVWDEAAKRLTINVVDKPTVNNFYHEALSRYQREPFTFGAANPRSAKAKSIGGRDIGFLLVTYFNTDVERFLKFRIWRDELLRLKLGGAYHEVSNRVLDDLFGGPAKLDDDFTRWAQQRRSSFRYIEWGWEQDGETLMSYGFPNNGIYSQTDLLHPPGEKPVHDPLLMDYARRSSVPDLVGPIARGVEEPAIGCVLGYRIDPGTGLAGLGLGVEGRTFWRVMVDGGKRLILDGSDLGGGKQEAALPEAITKASAANNHQLGLTVKIGMDALEVIVRAGKAGAITEFKTKAPITQKQRARLLAKPLAVLSRGGLHFITPFIDVPIAPEPDPAVPAPPNRWRNAGDRPLYAVYRSAWRLGERAPKSLIGLRGDMLAAAAAAPEKQKQALEAFASRLPKVLADVRSCGAAEDAISATLSWLMDPLLSSLSDRDWDKRRTASIALANVGATAVDSLLAIVKGDGAATARAEAMLSLGTIGPAAKKAIGPLVDVVRTSRILHLRTAAMNALSKMNPEAGAALFEALDDLDVDGRVRVINSLTPEQIKPAKDTLRKLLGDGSEEVRAASAKALARFGPAITEDIRPLLLDKEAAVRAAAIQALESFETTERLGKLLLEETKIEPREALATILAKRGSGAFAVLTEALRSKDFRVVKTAVSSIVQMEDRAEAMIPVLIEVLLAKGSEDHDVLGRAMLRINPIYAARRLAEKLQAADLIAMLRKESADVQELACLALVEQGPSANAALPSLTGLLKDTKTPVNVLAAAARAVHAIGPKDTTLGATPDLTARLVRGTHERSTQLRNEGMNDLMKIGLKGETFEAILAMLSLDLDSSEANEWLIHHANASNAWNLAGPNLVRVLGQFGSRSKLGPTRLSPAAEEAVKAHLWRYLQQPMPARRGQMQPPPLSEVAAVLPIDHLPWRMSAYLALDLLKDDPDFKDRTIQGKSPQEHFDAWSLWWREWARYRALHGLWSEMGFAVHHAFIWPNLLNMADLASDRIVQQRFRMLLDLTMIEDEQISIQGIRASRRGKRDEVGTDLDAFKDMFYGEQPRRFAHGNSNYRGIYWTTAYKLPAAAILLRKLNRPEAHYTITNQHFFKGAICAYATPHFILASQLSQPDGAMEFNGTWNRLVFDDSSAILFPLTEGNRRHLQYQNVYVTCVVGSKATRQTVDFSASLKTVQRENWFFASNGPAYVGIHVAGGFTIEKFDRQPPAPGRFDSIVLKDPQATVLLHAGDTATFGSFEKFQAALLTAPLKIDDESLHYAFPKMPALEFFVQPDRVSLIGGERHSYVGEAFVYDSPYLRARVNSAKVNVRVGRYLAVYDFDANTITEETGKP